MNEIGLVRVTEDIDLQIEASLKKSATFVERPRLR